MAGRIRDSDIALVRERSPIAEVVGATVTLRSAGGGRLKGLCPFHDEKTPSFSVNPSLGLYHCFGCGVSGDVITFVRETEALSFSEAVEQLASRSGVTLVYEQGGAAPGRSGGARQRLVEAHRAAAQFYVEQLASPDAALGRQFLAERGFDESAWAHFGVGYAPASWEALVRHLTGRGFSNEELLAGGLASQGRRGAVDRFRGRLVWPIRERAGDVIGFGARRLRDDDDGPKYLNTPETPLYHKSTVLYGLDLARKDIALRHQAVVVEGYTDVMACHLAGVTTAVATCGTAFGPDHINVLRLMLMDQDEFRGEVIYTFDGDEAGQKAALRAFAEDQRFVAQTFVAVGPDGMDPCDLRLARGDAAVRDLVAGREPLFTFVIRSTLTRYNLDTPEGRVQALAAAAPVVAGIRDRALRPEYARRLAGWLGMDVDSVVARVGELEGRAVARGRGAPPRGRSEPGRRDESAQNAPAPATGMVPAGSASGPAAGSIIGSAPGDPMAAAVEREALKIALQLPGLAGPSFDARPPEQFVVPGYRAIREAVAAAGGTVAGAALARAETGGWVRAVLTQVGTDDARRLVSELALEPLPLAGEPDERYTDMILARLEELAVTREIVEMKSRLERTNPLEAPGYQALSTSLFRLEGRKRSLRARALGER
jgi:DNA primase